MKRVKHKIYKRQSELTKSAVSAIVRKTDKRLADSKKLTHKAIGRRVLDTLLERSRRLEDE